MMRRMLMGMLVLTVGGGCSLLAGRAGIEVTSQDVANAVNCYAQVQALVPVVRVQVLACVDAAKKVRLGKEINPVDVANLTACATEIDRVAVTVESQVTGCKALVQGIDAKLD